ncbi:MAG TPA: universal stress protein [Xenococcaceae cyanobacterium]
MNNILAAIDFSDITDQVITTAAKIAQSFSSKLWLVHVAAPEPDFVGYDTGPASERDWRAKVLRQEHRYIQEKALELEASNIDVTPLLIQGVTVESIINKASQLNADLIVIGSHGHSALYKTLVGSISEGIIRQASCPIVIVPANNK